MTNAAAERSRTAANITLASRARRRRIGTLACSCE
jgi:hypothetical protein